MKSVRDKRRLDVVCILWKWGLGDRLVDWLKCVCGFERRIPFATSDGSADARAEGMAAGVARGVRAGGGAGAESQAQVGPCSADG